MSGPTYYVVAIKNTVDDSYYLSVSNRKQADTLKYFIEEHGRNPERYVKLNEAVKTSGVRKFICARLPNKTFTTKEAAEIFVFEKLKELPSEKVLNDKIIDPTRVECTGCTMKIRQEFIEDHKLKYCIGNAFSDF